MSKDSYSIYQVKEGDATWGLCFEPLERLQAAGNRVDRGNYDLVYAGPLEGKILSTAQILEALYTKFNIDHPADFAGRSLSVSDVVVLRQDEKVSAHYVDSVGFEEVPDFLDGPYRYYSTQRPVDIGTFPKTENGPERIENYDKRIPVEDGRFEAWGALNYATPLMEKQASDYELRAAFDNPDLYRYPPCQLEAQLQVVGSWEVLEEISKTKRLTEWQSDTGKFKLKDAAKRWPLNVRYNKIVAKQERPSITQQLKKGAEQAAKDNATRPTPDKKTDKDK